MTPLDELRRRLAERSGIIEERKPTMRIKRTVSPNGYANMDLTQLTSHLDRATVNEDRGKIVSELEERSEKELGLTLGHVIRIGWEAAIEKGYQGKPEPEILPEPDFPPEPEEPPIPSLQQRIKEIEAGTRDYGPTLLEAFESGWDFTAPPKFVPFRNGPDIVHSFLVSHKDDAGKLIEENGLSIDQINFALKIVRCYQGWKETQPNFKIVG